MPNTVSVAWTSVALVFLPWHCQHKAVLGKPSAPRAAVACGTGAGRQRAEQPRPRVYRAGARGEQPICARLALRDAVTALAGQRLLHLGIHLQGKTMPLIRFRVGHAQYHRRVRALTH